MKYNSENIFAKILKGEIPCKKVHEDEFSLAFHDINPAAPVHVLVLPKFEALSFNDFMQNAPGAMIEGFFKSVQKVASELGLEQSGYRLIMNHGADALQTVPHYHVHILGKRKLGALVVGDVHHS